MRFWGEALTELKLSRSRPYHKNDNRLDTAVQAAALDVLYEQLWGYYNLFQPVLHLQEKVVTADRLRRKWDAAATLYQRLVATGVLTPDQRAALDALHAPTNPRQLRRTIYDDLARLWRGTAPQTLAAD